MIWLAWRQFRTQLLVVLAALAVLAIILVVTGLQMRHISQGEWAVCLAKADFRVPVSYQPRDRYWTFQWIETAVFLVLAAAMVGFCSWRVRRRLVQHRTDLPGVQNPCHHDRTHLTDVEYERV